MAINDTRRLFDEQKKPDKIIDMFACSEHQRKINFCNNSSRRQPYRFEQNNKKLALASLKSNRNCFILFVLLYILLKGVEYQPIGR